jgi:hypothetical protein
MKDGLTERATLRSKNCISGTLIVDLNRKTHCLDCCGFSKRLLQEDRVGAEYRGGLSRIDDPARRIPAVIAYARDSAEMGRLSQTEIVFFG